jgi:hypothetical protein
MVKCEWDKPIIYFIGSSVPFFLVDKEVKLSTYIPVKSRIECSMSGFLLVKAYMVKAGLPKV